jgi:hypothetical protein
MACRTSASTAEWSLVAEAFANGVTAALPRNVLLNMPPGILNSVLYHKIK